jgi:putative ABC transport system substrate-binding protein
VLSFVEDSGVGSPPQGIRPQLDRMKRRNDMTGVPGATQRRRRSLRWCAADQGPFQTPSVERSRISGARLRASGATRCTCLREAEAASLRRRQAASGTRDLARRAFIALLGGAALMWPLAARAQQPERMRRIGVLLPAASDDLQFQTWVGAFLQALALLGWSIGRNVRIDTRWATTNAAEIRRHAAELAALAPDVILASGSSTVGPLLQVTRTVPTVFPVAGDPVAAGFVDSLARPGGNATGFMTFEYGMAGKWLELLKEIAPGVKRVAVLRNPATPTGPAQFGVIQAVAPSLGVEVTAVNMRDAGEIERAVAAFARTPNGGLIVAASGLAQRHRDLIVTLAARHKLPAVYFERLFVVAAGGLISYGPDLIDQYRRAAGYVDRILKGEKPADLPVQAPTKYETVLNLKTAKALGLTVPPSVLARADEVIE